MGGTHSYHQYSREPRPLSVATLDAIYSMPRPALTYEDHLRVRHEDLTGLDDTELACEASRVMSRLAREHDRERRGWLVERRDAIRTEQRRRDAEARREAAAPQPTALVWGTTGHRPTPSEPPARPRPDQSSRPPRVELRGGKVVRE